jgi:hypothetical protein
VATVAISGNPGIYAVQIRLGISEVAGTDQNLDGIGLFVGSSAHLQFNNVGADMRGANMLMLSNETMHPEIVSRSTCTCEARLRFVVLSTRMLAIAIVMALMLMLAGGSAL